MNIPLENIHYDEASAIEEIKKLRKEIPAYLTKHQFIENAVVGIVVSLIVLSVIATVQGGEAMLKSIIPIFSICAVYAAGEAIGLPIYDETSFYSANALCCLHIQKKNAKILAGDVDDDNCLRLTLEGVDHTVEKLKIKSTIKRISRTDIAEPYLELKENTLFVPYISEP